MTRERPESWPVLPAVGPNRWPVLDRPRILETAAGPALPDSSWIPFLAALVLLYPLERKEAKRLKEDLLRHAPELPRADALRHVKLAKGAGLAKEMGLDLELFGMAMLLADPVFGINECAKLLGEERAFELARQWRHFEWQLGGKHFPRGMSRLEALETLALQNSVKLRSAAGVEELASLPKRVGLSLVFCGRPDIRPEMLFRAPDLALFAAGDFGSLAFETTGSKVQLALEQLVPLGRWTHLAQVSLRQTTLARPSLRELADICARLPETKTLVLEVSPQGDWRAQHPELDLRIGLDQRPAP